MKAFEAMYIFFIFEMDGCKPRKAAQIASYVNSGSEMCRNGLGEECENVRALQVFRQNPCEIRNADGSHIINKRAGLAFQMSLR